MLLSALVSLKPYIDLGRGLRECRSPSACITDCGMAWRRLVSLIPGVAFSTRCPASSLSGRGPPEARSDGPAQRDRARGYERTADDGIGADAGNTLVAIPEPATPRLLALPGVVLLRYRSCCCWGAFLLLTQPLWRFTVNVAVALPLLAAIKVV